MSTKIGVCRRSARSKEFEGLSGILREQHDVLGVAV
jgi:hypothetical protein